MFDIVDRALELTPDERPEHLERACAGDPSLAASVAALLADADAASLLESPAMDFAAPMLDDLPDADDVPAGTLFGPWRVIREIGQGGMGTVHLAERADRQYEKDVALKVLHGWSARSQRQVRRFREERQILAALDHPDIARLLDGGVTPDGLPWFAMELVDGVAIDRYCERDSLPIERRLELFCRVCSAVQYAHRNLVVHRDLKPANILVTDAGQPKLLDFGIAKLLGPDAVDVSVTITGDRLMTPLYASPEQIRGESISTASDVYSLGVLLYVLLSGRHPYRLETRAPHEVAGAILREDVEPPSVAVLREQGATTRVDPFAAPTLISRGDSRARTARRLRGDLDTIVAKAMQKDPADRYGSAEQLEADIRRHLDGLPLAARAESRFARARKFVRRNRIAVIATAGIVTLLLGFVVQSVRIRAQASRIAVERDRAEQVSAFLVGLFRTSDPYAATGGQRTARELLDSGAAQIDRALAGRPDIRSEMMLVMGRAYLGLGERDRARRFLESGLSMRRAADPGQRTGIVETLEVLALLLLEQGDLPAAERAWRETLALRHQLDGARHPNIGRALNGLAAVFHAQGRFSDADSVFREAIAIDEARTDEHRLDLARGLEGLARTTRERGDPRRAQQLFREVLALRRAVLSEEHPQVAASIVDLASVSGAVGEVNIADSLFRYAVEMQRQRLGDDHPDVAATEADHSRLLHRQGRTGEALAAIRRAAPVAERLPVTHPLRASVLIDHGDLLLETGDPSRAETLFRESLALRKTALPPAHPHIAEAQALLGRAIARRGRHDEAERYLLDGYEGLRAAFGDGDPRARTVLENLVALYEASAQPGQAATYRARLHGGRR